MDPLTTHPQIISQSLQKALTTKGVNEIVDFVFWPVGIFPGSKCVSAGSDENCQMDRLEACLLQKIGCLGGNCTTSTQAELATFLNCFEGENGRAKTLASAKTCASTSGIDFTATEACYNSADESAKAFALVTDGAKDGLKGAKCFPWVTLDGKLYSDASSESCVPADDQKNIIAAVCKAYNGTKPAACV
jgi:hypothetical protein